MVDKGKVAAGVVGALVSIPIAWKLGLFINDFMMKKAQDPEEVVDENACKMGGFHWFDRKCHAEPEEEVQVLHCCQEPGHGDICFNTRKELVDHYIEVHPGVLIPPDTPTLVVRPIIDETRGF